MLGLFLEAVDTQMKVRKHAKCEFVHNTTPLKTKLFSVLPEPVSEGHHDIQRCQEEDEMEEEVAVRHPLRLVMNNLLTAFVVIINHKLIFNWKKKTKISKL